MSDNDERSTQSKPAPEVDVEFGYYMFYEGMRYLVPVICNEDWQQFAIDAIEAWKAQQAEGKGDEGA